MAALIWLLLFVPAALSSLQRITPLFCALRVDGAVVLSLRNVDLCERWMDRNALDYGTISGVLEFTSRTAAVEFVESRRPGSYYEHQTPTVTLQRGASGVEYRCSLRLLSGPRVSVDGIASHLMRPL